MEDYTEEEVKLLVQYLKGQQIFAKLQAERLLSLKKFDQTMELSTRIINSMSVCNHKSVVFRLAAHSFANLWEPRQSLPTDRFRSEQWKIIQDSIREYCDNNPVMTDV